MLVKVLKPFPYGADGIHARDLVEGDEEEIHDALVPGLIAEGYVAEVPTGLARTVATMRSAEPPSPPPMQVEVRGAKAPAKSLIERARTSLRRKKTA